MNNILSKEISGNKTMQIDTKQKGVQSIKINSKQFKKNQYIIILQAKT